MNAREDAVIINSLVRQALTSAQEAPPSVLRKRADSLVGLQGMLGDRAPAAYRTAGDDADGRTTARSAIPQLAGSKARGVQEAPPSVL